jgi:hypothetical protein
MLEGLLIHAAVEVLFQLTRDCGRAPGARTVSQTLGPLLRKTLDPFAEGGIGEVEGRGDGVDMVAGDDLPNGLHTAKDPNLLGLCQDGLSGQQRMIGKVAFQGAHGKLLGGEERSSHM